ncbi:hypothetical protein [Halomarina oriensis]|uniref:Uncharacterized protein n=1 Tax=Halomarina oriensis TaxID=671145 RepID=A0A6B0GX00_9EURY|nr:hypothetical protein [Halomarina oriensis]MWG36665.1 hypothetical protein [Halomarina oriensis]
MNTGDDHAVPYCVLTRDPSGWGRRPPREAPTFARSRGESEYLSVTSRIRYGSSTCDRIALETVELTAENELRVVVGATSKASAGPTCTDDIDDREYELVVGLDEVPIEAVRLTERPFDGPANTWTKTLPDR